MLIVTHHMHFAEHCADRVLFFENGVIPEDSSRQNCFMTCGYLRTRRFVEGDIRRLTVKPAGCAMVSGAMRVSIVSNRTAMADWRVRQNLILDHRMRQQFRPGH